VNNIQEDVAELFGALIAQSKRFVAADISVFWFQLIEENRTGDIVSFS
jgi:hypothetical protein